VAGASAQGGQRRSHEARCLAPLHGPHPRDGRVAARYLHPGAHRRLRRQRAPQQLREAGPRRAVVALQPCAGQQPAMSRGRVTAASCDFGCSHSWRSGHFCCICLLHACICCICLFAATTGDPGSAREPSSPAQLGTQQADTGRPPALFARPPARRSAPPQRAALRAFLLYMLVICLYMLYVLVCSPTPAAGAPGRRLSPSCRASSAARAAFSREGGYCRSTWGREGEGPGGGAGWGARLSAADANVSPT
jgi:hypothetical protein